MLASNLKPMREYNQFTFDPANRDLTQRHRERLSDSIESMYLLDLYPLVATTEKIIMDGQNRFSVARDSLLPFYAQIGDDIAIEDVAEANANTDHYTEEDALAVYTKMEIPAYLYLQEFLSRNPHAFVRDARAWLDDEGLKNDFIDGNFVVRRPEYAQVVAERVGELIGLHPWVRNSVYKQALANLTLNPFYDHERMMGRLAKVPTRLLPCKMEAEAFTVLQSIYNYGIFKDNRIELKKVAPKQMINRYDKGDTTQIHAMDMPERGITFQRQVEVYCTDDLEQFTIHPSARPLLDYRLKRMVSFMKRRNLLRYYPIVVNRNFEVLDGQKRMMAAKELNYPVHYIIANNFSLHMSVLAAGRSRAWLNPDYLKHFCVLGDAEYIYLREYRQQHPHVALSPAIRFLGGSGGWQEVHYRFKTGRFVSKDRKEAHRVAVLLNLVEDKRLKRNTTFQLALFDQIFNPKIDVAIFVQRLNRNREQMGTFANIQGCIDQMSNVYNYGISEGKRVKLERVRST